MHAVFWEEYDALRVAGSAVGEIGEGGGGGGGDNGGGDGGSGGGAGVSGGWCNGWGGIVMESLPPLALACLWDRGGYWRAHYGHLKRQVREASGDRGGSRGGGGGAGGARNVGGRRETEAVERHLEAVKVGLRKAGTLSYLQKKVPEVAAVAGDDYTMTNFAGLFLF